MKSSDGANNEYQHQRTGNINIAIVNLSNERTERGSQI